MTNTGRMKDNYELKHIIARFAVHEFHYRICRIDKYHQPDGPIDLSRDRQILDWLIELRNMVVWVMTTGQYRLILCTISVAQLYLIRVELYRLYIPVGCEVFTAVVMKSIIFWDMTTCSQMSPEAIIEKCGMWQHTATSDVRNRNTDQIQLCHG
jgi:hypothetical protein